MIEFFIALFGGAYLTGRRIKENAKRNTSETRLNKQKNMSEMLWSTPEEERKLQNALIDEHDKWVLLNSISDDMITIFGENWQEAFDGDWHEKYRTNKDFGCILNAIYNPYHVALHILLSKRGKIKWLLTTGYEISNPDGIFEQEGIRTLQIVERNIREHYPEYDLQLFFMPKHELDANGMYAFCNETWQGKVVWNYEINDRWVKKYDVPIRRLW